MDLKTLNKQADEIIEIAKKSGVQSNFFFLSTFERYLTQLRILNELEDKMKEDGLLVKKSYVKGTKNLYSNPAIVEFNRTTDSANKTVATLMRIIKGFEINKQQESEKEDDILMRVINGG